MRQLFILTTILLVAAAGAFAEGSAEGSTIQDEFETTVWTGERITFTKDDGADPEDSANQDRLTDSVWITRGNRGGQIFNIAQRSRYDKAASPVGTLWAVGTTADIADLEFSSFRTAVGSPQDVVGQDLVMYIREEQIFLDVRFLSWSKEKRGGFSYERSTPAAQE